MQDMTWLFSGWTGVARTAAVGVLAYAGLILLLRVSGKRTLGKMNAFDLVVTVGLGSTLGSILTSKSVALVEGLAAFAVLIGLQYSVAWMSLRFAAVRRLVKAEPALLLYRGRLLDDALRRERVSADEVFAAVRKHGVPSLDGVEGVVLETDGSFAVVARTEGTGAADVLEDLPAGSAARPAGTGTGG